MINLQNINLLLVTEDKELNQKAKQNREKFRNLFIKDKDSFIHTFLNSNVYIDVIVLDLDNILDLDLSPILYVNKNQQFIFLASKRQIYLKFLSKFSGGNSAVLFKPIKFSAILDNLLLIYKNEKPKNIKLNDKISINLTKEKIYENSNEIFLTPMMHKLLLLFSANLGSLVTFDMIESSVYENTPSSRIIVQNLVGNLKRTLNLNIENVYGKGYVLNGI